MSDSITLSPAIYLFVVTSRYRLYDICRQHRPDDDIDRRMIAHINHLLRHYCLTHRYEADDIYNEVLWRIQRHILGGGTIDSPLPYCKAVAKSVIVKHVKTEIKLRLLPPLLVEKSRLSDGELLLDKYEKPLNEALNILKVDHLEDFRLIELFYLQELSWGEITGQCGGVNCQAMRKRGQRAKEKLKTIFGKILEEKGSF